LGTILSKRVNNTYFNVRILVSDEFLDGLIHEGADYVQSLEGGGERLVAPLGLGLQPACREGVAWLTTVNVHLLGSERGDWSGCRDESVKNL
jgi:hypothetical protein